MRRNVSGNDRICTYYNVVADADTLIDVDVHSDPAVVSDPDISILRSNALAEILFSQPVHSVHHNIIANCTLVSYPYLISLLTTGDDFHVQCRNRPRE